MIEIKNLCKSYQRAGEPPLQVLKNVNLSVEQGDFVAIVGASGSGKSTLLNILGLLDRPDSGSYSLAGEDVAELPADKRAAMRNELIGFVFQQFHLLPRTTACENVELPLLYSKESDADIQRKARDSLCRVGLEERLTHYPSELSGGQQQRVAIARALVNNPAIILADEPTGNLDEASGKNIMNLLRDLHHSGSTILLITHDANVAGAASRVLRMEQGQLTEVAAGVAS